MLRMVDILEAVARWRARTTVLTIATTDDIKQFDDIQAESERSRLPLTMTRAAVRVGLVGMMRYFGVGAE